MTLASEGARRGGAVLDAVAEAVANGAWRGLSRVSPELAPWLFYDERGSELFEEITQLPEYYLTRTERGILEEHGAAMVAAAAGDGRLSVVELGAGTAAKTGLLLQALAKRQGRVLYQPVDVSASALAEAARSLEMQIPGLEVRPQVADYTREPLALVRDASEPGQPESDARLLALYIGSSIGNFAPPEAVGVLGQLRGQMRTGDQLLLGTDLAPGPAKPVERLVAAYDDKAGVTAAFNQNVLVRLNRDLGTDFDVRAFLHRTIWNAAESRIEMHLEAVSEQVVRLPGSSAGPGFALHLRAGETIHTENSYKFTEASVTDLLETSGFRTEQGWSDREGLFLLTLAAAV